MHLCHAHGCKAEVPPSRLFCLPHWKRLSRAVQRAVWAEYRPGQEVDKEPSLRYCAVQRFAVCELAFRPHDEEAAAHASRYLIQAEVYACRVFAQGFGDPLERLRKAQAPWEGMTPEAFEAAMSTLFVPAQGSLFGED